MWIIVGEYNNIYDTTYRTVLTKFVSNHCRIIGGYVKDRKWAEEAEHVKKMIKEKEGDIQVTCFV